MTEKEQLIAACAEEAVEYIVNDLCARSGLGDVWDDINEEVKEGIVSNWERIVRDALVAEHLSAEGV